MLHLKKNNSKVLTVRRLGGVGDDDRCIFQMHPLPPPGLAEFSFSPISNTFMKSNYNLIDIKVEFHIRVHFTLRIVPPPTLFVNLLWSCYETYTYFTPLHYIPQRV